MHRMGVDVGYGYCKAVTSGGRKVVFPSLVAPDEGRRSFGLLGSAVGKLNHQVKLAGPRVRGSFAVGEAAMRKDMAVRAWDLKEQVAHQNTLVLLFTACALLGGSGDVELGVGLPLEVFVSARERVKPWVEGASCQVTVGDRPAVALTFRRVSVFPQAGGAYLHALLREDGQVRDRSLLEAGVGVIDVGYRTTDLLLMARTSDGMIPDVDRCTTIDQGVSAVHEYVWKVLQERLGEPVDIAWVERAFLWNRGLLTFRGECIDLEPDAEVAREALANQIAARVKRLWGRAADLAGKVILTGGGGADLHPWLSRSLPGLVLGEDPLFANALGYLSAMAGGMR